MSYGTVQWKYNNKRYVLHRNVLDECYLNGYYCPEGNEILEGLKRTATVEEAKKRAEAFDNLPADKKMKCPPKKWTFSEVMQKIGEIIVGVIVILVGLGIVGGVLYLIFQLWWIFVGDWAFNGPWANDVSGGEVAFETIIFFIALIVVIEEVIRRCINGHF